MKVEVIALSVLLLTTVALASPDPSRISIAPADEPGERLTVSGRVTDEAGRPIAGADVYVYQTDAAGKYRHTMTGKRELAGTVKSGSDGRYEFATIRPGSYPGERILAHIHYEVEADGFPRKVFEIVFEDDPILDDTWRRRIASNPMFQLRPIEKDAKGNWRTTADIVMRRQ